MSLRLGALQDALIDGGTSPELASKAAEELAGYEREIAGIKTDLAALKWGMATMVALQFIAIGKLFIR